MYIFQLKNFQFMYGLYTTELSVVSQMIGKVEREHQVVKDCRMLGTKDPALS